MEGILSAIKQLIQTATDFFRRALKAIEDFFKWAQDAFDYFWELLPVLPEYVFHKLVSGIVKFFQWLPVPVSLRRQVTRSSQYRRRWCISPMHFQIGPGVTVPGRVSAAIHPPAYPDYQLR
ncbi:hypothetical protein [Pseudomonas aeruginosa]|uniref:hypothetical protein n=1 Tax=Pseudomonas aeruginosa TaxID=287 RepID=UPI0021B49397|nr:hypothetical protein [Pseudomonas aeruginosa]MCT7417846.1 hypothetical protein [Pseudomonas aeruginosa]